MAVIWKLVKSGRVCVGTRILLSLQKEKRLLDTPSILNMLKRYSKPRHKTATIRVHRKLKSHTAVGDLPTTYLP